MDRPSRRALLLSIGELAATLAMASCGGPNTPSTATPQQAVTPPASRVRGAAPLPVGAPTPGGPPPTVVGASTPTPATAPNASGPFSVEGAASPVSAPSVVPSPSAQAAASILITPDRRFDPGSVVVGRGQSVVWRNMSRNPQTITCDPSRVSDPSHVVFPPGAEPFDSGVINPNSSFSHTFTVPGEYQYVSLPFEALGMVGQVDAS